jgi:hypothetical protein
MSAKQRATATQIQGAIQQQIWECREPGGACRDSGAPMPRPAYPADNNGSNWKVDFLPNTSPHCEEFVLTIVNKAMRKYELISDQFPTHG